ncbi:nuclear protein UL55A [Testudinid alphaherpesvirus 3]|uniref:Nuclear protein UL55A n=1 Tax=Testudinid alphaherpesvirus 3 TaxID=2560801 RepID=A0A0K1R209_9ALPH|nr:nuclear protein UL55A [Testudinid alphaherpesvirus 3]AIU39327.1 nuclear protein UL55A [Testudinid alphaherpesvirus 3]AKI81722.1 nuclear protein UL55A [Testudinid alphaherpesvirus 3]AKV40736.1 UL55b protein [Testudinid alphaherpesvirus 3]
MADESGPYVLGGPPMAIGVDPGPIWNSECWTLYRGTYNALPAAVGFYGPVGRDAPKCEKLAGPIHFYFMPIKLANSEQTICQTELVDFMCRFATPLVKTVGEDAANAQLPNTMCDTPLLPGVIYPVTCVNTISKILSLCVPRGSPEFYHQRCAIPCIGFHCHCEKPFGLYCRCLLKFVLEQLRPAVSDKSHNLIRVCYDYKDLHSRTIEFLKGEAKIL